MNLKLKLLTSLFMPFYFGFYATESRGNDLSWYGQDEEENDLYYDQEEYGVEKKNCNFLLSCAPYENVLNLKLLCACKVHAGCIESQNINAGQVDTRVLNTDSFCAQNIKSSSVCVDNLGVKDNACIETLTANDLQAGDLCVTGLTSLGEVCGLYRAIANFSAEASYTLGDDLNFDNVIDDPNSDVSLPFAYTAPVEGYYLVNAHVSQRDLITPSPVLGAPTAVLQLVVNGQVVRSLMTSFMSFSNHQQSNMTGVLRLMAGDVLTVRYIVNRLSDAGFVPVDGSVTIEDGLQSSEIVIHYLSSACVVPFSCEPRECEPCDSQCVVQPGVPCFP